MKRRFMTSQNGKGANRRKDSGTFREDFDSSKLWDNLKKKKEERESKEDKDV